MNVFRTVATVAAIMAVSGAPLAAQGKSGSAPKGGQAPTVESAAPKGNGHSPKTTTSGTNTGSSASGSTASAGGRGATQKATNAPTTGGGSGKKATTTTAGTTTGGTTGGSTTGTTTTTTNTTTTGGTTTTVAPPNALSMKLSKNPQQLARLTPMLPEGMTLEAATAGFRNQGQFIAALNASKSNNVKFADLQTAMTVDGLSLGQAVKQLRNAPPTTTTGGTTTGGTTTGTATGTGTGSTTPTTSNTTGSGSTSGTGQNSTPTTSSN